MPIDFIRTLVKNPKQIKTIGAILPSGKGLAREITRNISHQTPLVIELGPGTGAITQVALSKAPNTSLIGFELDEEMASIMKKKFPEVKIIHACARDINKHIDTHADCIISGIPWANIPSSEQEEMMKEIHNSLKSGGTFSTFAYIGPHLTKKGKAFRKLIESTFDVVETSPPIIKNSPPAFVYHCTKIDS